MKNQFLSLIMCMTLYANCMGFYANAETSQDSAERTIIVDLSDENSVKNIHGSNQYIETIELSEGEKVQIVLPDSDDIKYVSFTSYKHKAAVSHDLSLIGYCAGEDEVHVHYVTVSGECGNFLLNVKVLKSDISDDDRAELERLNSYPYDLFLRRQIELTGGLGANTARLTMDKVKDIISSADDFEDIFMQFNKYHSYPDVGPVGSGNTHYYWLDDNGSEYVELVMETELIIYGKVAEDGTETGYQILYPEKFATELLVPESETKDYYYIRYHQLDTVGTGTVKFKFIIEETGKEFTDTSGTFQLVTDFGTLDERVVKSWDISDGSEVTITDLPKKNSYELRYIDKSANNGSDEGIFIVDQNKGTGRFGFGLNDELNLTVYMTKFYYDHPYLLGDVNGDKSLNMADLVTLRNWLLGSNDTILINWRAADLCRDDVLDVFDYCRLKNIIITNPK